MVHPKLIQKRFTQVFHNSQEGSIAIVWEVVLSVSEGRVNFLCR